MVEILKSAFTRTGQISALLAVALAASTASAQDRTVDRTGGAENIGYVTGDPYDWPDHLEAVIAAPDNHKVLLENEHVRVLEVTLGPREVEPLHFHRWPSVLHIMQADEWIDRDADGGVIFDSREGPPLQFPRTLWKGPEAPHSPVNLSDDIEVRLLRVEIKPRHANEARPIEGYSLFPSDRSLTHAEDGVVLPDGRLLVGDWDHGLVTLAPDGTKRPFGHFAAAGFRTKPNPHWNSPNGVSFEPDGRHVLVADITGGHIYRVDTRTEAVTRIYDHPFGVNAAVRDPSGAIWFTQSTRNKAGEGSEARMFAAADKPLGDGAVWRIDPDQIGRPDPVATKVMDGLDFANGIAFDDRRGRLYVAEIIRSRILSFDVDPITGRLGVRRILATLPTPDNLELDANGMLWVASPFANAVYLVDPETGDRRTVFSPTPETSARIVAETSRRLEAGEPVLPLLTPEMWGPMPGLLTGVILTSDGTVYVSNLGDGLVRLAPLAAHGLSEQPNGENDD
ncbi:MAG: SMP-30/gluconolactonase/LRE family protein [Pacificimonas sp.]